MQKTRMFMSIDSDKSAGAASTAGAASIAGSDIAGQIDSSSVAKVCPGILCTLLHSVGAYLNKNVSELHKVRGFSSGVRGGALKGGWGRPPEAGSIAVNLRTSFLSDFLQ